MMHGPSPKSHREPWTSTQREKVAPAPICTTRSRPGTSVATPPAVTGRGPRPSAERWRQPKVQTRPRSVRIMAWPSPTATSTATSPGGNSSLGLVVMRLAAPAASTPVPPQTKHRPSNAKAMLKLELRASLRSGGNSVGSSCCASAPRGPSSMPTTLVSVSARSNKSTSGIIQPPESRNKVSAKAGEKVVRSVPALGRRSAPAAAALALAAALRRLRARPWPCWRPPSMRPSEKVASCTPFAAWCSSPTPFGLFCPSRSATRGPLPIRTPVLLLVLGCIACAEKNLSIVALGMWSCTFWQRTFLRSETSFNWICSGTRHPQTTASW
mmetsp:Transcript_172603/g.548051  ORF Transcript_172603/g.548051 Transcript_172603/m.548051 type:complete len:326 (-) Transcript_172603:1693-2670(-)